MSEQGTGEQGASALATRRCVVVYNPRASGADDTVRARLEALAPAGAFLVVGEVDQGELLSRVAAELRRVEATHLVAAGGDGTVSGVLPLALTHDVCVCPVPLGTSSSFARAFGFGSADDALVWLADTGAREVRADVGFANGQPMALLAAVGLHAETIGGAKGSLKAALGSVAYLAQFAAALDAATPFEVEVSVGETRFVCTSTAVTIANAARPAALLAQGTGEVVPDDGLLDVTIVQASTAAEIVVAGLELARAALTGEATSQRVIAFRARALTITLDAPRALLIDGEVCGETTRLDVSLRPSAMRVADRRAPT